MINKQEILEALDSASPHESLRRLVEHAYAHGASEEQLLRSLEELRPELSARDRPDQEDIVLDVMDCLVGWCAPSARITSRK